MRKVRLGNRTKICGVGINDADYSIKIHEPKEVCARPDGMRDSQKFCHFYSTWVGLIYRCYDDKTKKKQPTYKDCTMDEEWLLFSNFKKWMELQPWENNQLDKDLIFEGNKHYGVDTCLFIPSYINTFITGRRLKSKYMNGVSLKANIGRFQVHCSNPFKKKSEFLGYFDCEMEAHLAWKKRKHEHALTYAEMVQDPLVKSLLEKRYLN